MIPAGCSTTHDTVNRFNRWSEKGTWQALPPVRQIIADRASDANDLRNFSGSQGTETTIRQCQGALKGLQLNRISRV
jgi:transposase